MITGGELGRIKNEDFMGVHDHFIGKTEETRRSLSQNRWRRFEPDTSVA
jgi:hypothetical protein